MTTKDYSVALADHRGRTVEISINGASVDEMIAVGYSEQEARESVESDAFAKAIARGEIDADAWVI